MQKVVLIPEDIHIAGKEYLLDRGYSLIVGIPTDVSSLKQAVEHVDALIVRNAIYPKEVIAAGKNLKVIARHGVGVDNIDIETAEKRGIWVTNGPNSNSNAVAEFVVATIMTLSTNILIANNQIREGNWNYRLQMQRNEVMGKIVGIIGFGGIGQLVAKKLVEGLGMRAIVYSIPRVSESPYPDSLTICDNLDELLSTSDFVTCHLPLNTHTQGMLNYDAFSLMKRTAYLINCSRGGICVEDDLMRALNESVIAGAALDVFEEEPLVMSPLFEMENVILTPHMAGFSEESKINMAVFAAMGVDDVLNGRKPAWPVNTPI